MNDDGDDNVAQAILVVYEKLHDLGFDVSGGDAAEIFNTALGACMEHVQDPRQLGGAIAGPGGPFTYGGVVIDTSRALIVDYQEVAKIDPEHGARGQEEAFAFMFAGRINQTPDRASIVLLGDIDFMAATITELHGVAERAGLQDKLHTRCEERWSEMPHPTNER